MVFYAYTCPVCGITVRLDHASVQLLETKVCQCDGAPVETVEETPQ